MPNARSRRIPSYRHHRATGQAVVTLDGRDFYLGRHGTEASRDEYDRVTAEWLSGGRRLNGAASAENDMIINEMLVGYLRFVDSYYLKNGKPTKEPVNIKLALRPLRKLYGLTSAAAFGPKSLKVVRQAMIADDLCRNEVNKRVRKIIRAFKWAVSEEIIPPAVHQALV